MIVVVRPGEADLTAPVPACPMCGKARPLILIKCRSHAGVPPLP